MVGFDDSVISVCTTPPLSSVHQPVEAMAAAATRALVNRQLPAHWRHVFPAVLQVRQELRRCLPPDVPAAQHREGTVRAYDRWRGDLAR